MPKIVVDLLLARRRQNSQRIKAPICKPLVGPVGKLGIELIRLPVDPAAKGFAFPIRFRKKFIGEITRGLIARFHG